MKCCKITAHLKNGLCVNDPWSPSLDSILAYFKNMEDMGQDNFNISTAMGDQTTCDNLPVEKQYFNDLWWYNCSTPEYDSLHEIKRQFYKKFNIDFSLMIEKKVKNVELTKNQFKNYSLFFMQHLVKNVSWHLVCDIDKTMELLRNCKQIGGKRGKGMGEVVDWSYSEGDIEKAKLNRFLPIKYAENKNIDGTIMLRGFRPSFRLNENQTVCVIKN